ncbi:MAG: sulfite exporter TauE/SafE family protein [Phycisphaerales bacterium JB043]
MTLQDPLIATLLEILVGLIAGLLGGLLGIGGSVIMIPSLAIIFGSRDPSTQHLYQASAMAVNVAVSVPASIRHWRAGATHTRLLKLVLPAALVSIVAGVLLSNMIDGRFLRLVFALFLLYVAGTLFLKATRKHPDLHPDHERVTPARGGLVGLIMGSAAGLLGVGGGVLAVPAAQTLCKVPLRNAIAVSSTAMCITASIGATIKITTLPEHGHPAMEALRIALIMTPSAILGGWWGARLTHVLPVHVVRWVLLILLLVAAWRMAISSRPADQASLASQAPISTCCLTHTPHVVRDADWCGLCATRA